MSSSSALSSTSSSFSRHTLRQFKFILPGAAVTWYLGVHDLLWRTAEGGGWGSKLVVAWLGLGVTTVVLFLYLLTIPWTKGVQPNYRSWRESTELSSVIPVLALAIVLGWSMLSITLGTFAGLGLLKGAIGASGLYALSFGLMGVLPVPKVTRKHDRS